MKCYYLLRDNRESGPFTQEQLKGCGLLSTDLIWIEGESQAWEHPTAIDELKAFTKESPGKQPSIPESKPSTVTIPAPSLQEYRRAIGEEEISLGDSAEEGPAYYYKSKTVFRQHTASSNSFSIGSGVFGAVILLVGLGLCAFVFVNMVNGFVPTQRAASSEAVEIKSEVLPVSNASHAAHASMVVSTAAQTLNSISLPVSDTTNLKTALAKKTEKLAIEASKKKHIPKADTTAKKQTVADLQTPPKDEAESKPAEEKSEPIPAANRTPSLQLSANDYKVGLFGGVSNLEISVANPSAQKISKAIIEVEFLKPNGGVAKTQMVTTENISPNGSATVAVPSSSRGVKVRYHVVSVDVQN